MPMKCPFCGEEMTPGVIQSRDGVYWSREAGGFRFVRFRRRSCGSIQLPSLQKNHPGLLRSPSPAIKFQISPCKTRKSVLSYPMSTGELAAAG